MSLIQIHECFKQMQHQLDSQLNINAQPLIDLVALLRPKNPQDLIEIENKFELFWHALAEHPQSLRFYVQRLLYQYQLHDLLSDCGIWSLNGFWNQLLQRLGTQLLPLPHDEQLARHLLSEIFSQKTDAEWLQCIPLSAWQRLWLLMYPVQQSELAEQIQHQVLKALTVLSYRISGIGLHPELLHALPELSEYESPFLAQNREILNFINALQPGYQQQIAAEISIAPSLVMLEQCREMLSRVRRATKKTGVSMGLTYLLTVLTQCLDRLEVLLQLLVPHQTGAATQLQLLMTDLVTGDIESQSVATLLRSTSELIALQVTENASKTAENYVSTDYKGFARMYRAAAGAGAIVAIMATIKSLLSRLILAPVAQALFYSLNYALGFMLIHVLHFTVATKQPAMTAAALAATVQQQQGRKQPQLTNLAALMVNIMRSQFIAILGNISIAMPVAAIIALFWQWSTAAPLMTHAKALSTLHDLNPFTSMAIPHAAIAGVCLFLSGLLAGFFDNFAVYRKIGARLQAHSGLQRRLGTKRTAQFAQYMQTNFGALAGNLVLGIMLGSMGTLGMILGLSLDIRHIAFASANLLQGLLCLNDANDIALILVSFLGVLLIGLTNLLVCFGLTVWMALRARGIRFFQWKGLLTLVYTHFSNRPQDFFWPPKPRKQLLQPSQPLPKQPSEHNHSAE